MIYEMAIAEILHVVSDTKNYVNMPVSKYVLIIFFTLRPCQYIGAIKLSFG